jgi:hypothetical protein
MAAVLGQGGCASNRARWECIQREPLEGYTTIGCNKWLRKRGALTIGRYLGATECDKVN